MHIQHLAVTEETIRKHGTLERPGLLVTRNFQDVRCPKCRAAGAQP